MKKLIIVCALLSASLFVFAKKADTTSVSDNEIWRVIQENSVLNKNRNKVNDPNAIVPNQHLYFIFKDGFERDIIVKKGDTEWSLVKSTMIQFRKHGTVTSTSDKPKTKPAATPTVTSTAPMKAEMYPLIILLFIIGAGVTIFLLRKESRDRKRKNEEIETAKDPITSGPAMREGGVNDADATAYAREVATRTFDLPNINVKDVVKGRLSGTNVEVSYLGQPAQRRTFTNIVAFRGIAEVNGTEQFIYFLQGCGNDARVGSYYTGQSIQFIADAIQPVTTQPEVVEEVKEESNSIHLSTHVLLPVDVTKVVGVAIESMKNTDGTFTLNDPSGMEIYICTKAPKPAVPGTPLLNGQIQEAVN